VLPHGDADFAVHVEKTGTAKRNRRIRIAAHPQLAQVDIGDRRISHIATPAAGSQLHGGSSFCATIVGHLMGKYRCSSAANALFAQ
jgi:hypothetical protein